MDAPIFCGTIEYNFKDWFDIWIKLYGAKYMWKILVDSGDMSAWEFRFWVGHRGLV